jgi:hypothetical protein
LGSEIDVSGVKVTSGFEIKTPFEFKRIVESETTPVAAKMAASKRAAY